MSSLDKNLQRTATWAVSRIGELSDRSLGHEGVQLDIHLKANIRINEHIGRG